MWLGSTGLVATSGFSKARERQLALWRPTALAAGSVKTHVIDQSTGVMDLLYDEDARLLFVAGKGDSSIRIFELLDDDSGFFEVRCRACALPLCVRLTPNRREKR